MQNRKRNRRDYLLAAILVVALLALTGCGATPTPEIVKETVEVPVKETVEVPVQETVEVTVKETVEVQVKETVEVPVEETVVVEVLVTNPVTIKYWRHFTDSGDAVTQKMIEAFKEVAPHITVEYEGIPDNEYEQRLAIATAAGEGPDAYQLYTQQFERFNRAGLLAPVDPTVFGYESHQEMLDSHFVPGIMENAFKSGKLYAGGVPEFGPWILAYNMDAFDKAGVEYPSADEPMTWDEYFEMAKQLTIREGDEMVQMGEGQWVTSQDNPVGTFVIMDPMFKQLGGDAFDEATGKPINRDIWLQMANLMYEATPAGEYGYVDMGFPTSTNAHPEMFNGRMAMLMAGIWAEGWGMAVNPDLRIGFAPYPAVDDDNDALSALGYFWVANAHTSLEKQRAAWQWINFLSNAENVFTWYDEAGEFQPRNVEGFEEHAVEKTPGMAIVIANTPRFKTPAFGESGSEYWDVMRRMAENIFKNGASPEEAVDAAWSEMEALSEQ
jgi:multiple sugar transport system substrate-binding protein